MTLTNGLTVTGSLNAENITGSLLGTASFATQALSASWAPGGTTINTGSFATTGSNTFQGDQIISGSGLGNDLEIYNQVSGVTLVAGSAGVSTPFGLNTDSISSINGDITLLPLSGYSVTSNGNVVVGTGYTLTADSITGSLQGTASFANNATSASYALTASYAANAGSGGVAAGDIYSYTFLTMGA